jgi:GH15 family glucan-1,4-alpha-glucosidase
MGTESAVAPSVAAILRNQHPSGAIVASPDFSQYQYCWLRDGSFIAHALDRW